MMRLVTWENRILKLNDAQTTEAKQLRELAPGLSIINPKDLADIVRLKGRLE